MAAHMAIASAKIHPNFEATCKAMTGWQVMLYSKSPRRRGNEHFTPEEQGQIPRLIEAIETDIAAFAMADYRNRSSSALLVEKKN